ncbi:hypothetical protein QTP86_001060, partial [Hemibagrus guttatus]
MRPRVELHGSVYEARVELHGSVYEARVELHGSVYEARVELHGSVYEARVELHGSVYEARVELHGSVYEARVELHGSVYEARVELHGSVYEARVELHGSVYEARVELHGSVYEARVELHGSVYEARVELHGSVYEARVELHGSVYEARVELHGSVYEARVELHGSVYEARVELHGSVYEARVELHGSVYEARCFSAVLVTAMNGNTIEESPSSIAPPCGWREFCELHASATARELAQHYLRFARTRPPHDVVSPEKFGRHFSLVFQHHFWRDVAKEEAPPPPMTVRTCTFPEVLDYREAGRPVGGASFVILPPKLEQEQPLQNFTTHRHTQGVELAENYAPSPPVPLPSPVNVISKFGRSVCKFFKKRPSRDDSVQDSSGDESERRGGASRAGEHSPVTAAPSGFLGLLKKRKKGKGDVCKEGQLSYLEVNDAISDTTPRWMRCRLLVRRSNDRFQLELYNPPK